MLLVLLIVIAGLAYLGWTRSSTSAPSPAATANPATLPPAGGAAPVR
jgi:hypothetical protein